MKTVYDFLSPEDQRLVARWRALATAVAISILFALVAILVLLQPDTSVAIAETKQPIVQSAYVAESDGHMVGIVQASHRTPGAPAKCESPNAYTERVRDQHRTTTARAGVVGSC